jgi:hypothetical protein
VEPRAATDSVAFGLARLEGSRTGLRHGSLPATQLIVGCWQDTALAARWQREAWGSRCAVSLERQIAAFEADTTAVAAPASAA